MSETRRRRKWDERGDQPTPPSNVVNVAARINEQLRQRPVFLIFKIFYKHF